MSRTLLFACLLAGALAFTVADSLVTFPYQENPCSCVLLKCTCCTGIQVSSVGFKKNVCVVLNVKLFPVSVGVTIKLDEKELAQFSFSDKNPPTYCIPIVLPVKVSMCLKMHDVKLSGLTNVQMCMTIYAGYEGSDFFVLPMNCVKVGVGNLEYFTTTQRSG